MELQGLQEALKVEIQCHQDGELKRQLHDRRITALSDKQNQTLCKGLNEIQNGQKVRSCPVSLLKPPGPGLQVHVVPAKAPVAVVTINGQKAAAPESLQTRTTMTASSNTGHAFRRAELTPPQMLGTLSAVPIKVPQVSSLHRLAGQAATLLPQVRPKTQIPDSLPPPSPCQDQQSLVSPRATAVVSPRSLGPTLPTANSTLTPDPPGDASPPPTGGPAGGPVTPGVAFAIIAAATAPPSGNGVTAKVQPLVFSADNKVIIIQPQGPPGATLQAPPTQQQATPPQQQATPPPKSPKKDEDPEKIAFMVALGLVTTEHLEEIQTKRQERKRRSTANPAYSGLFEPERKRLASHYLYLSARDSEDYCWKDDVEHEEVCSVCKDDGELQLCHNCPKAFHPTCLQPALKTPPRGPWYCPKCQKKVLNKENMSWPQNFVQSYVTHKTVRQEEKRRLLRRNSELKKECSHLEEEDEKLNQELKQCMSVRERLIGQQRDTEASLERLRSLIRLIQSHQLITVTMTTATATITATATATAAASLLAPPPWIKPTSTAGPSATPLSQEDANN